VVSGFVQRVEGQQQVALVTVVTSDGPHGLKETVIAEGFDVVAESGPVIGQLLDAFTCRAGPQVPVISLGIVTEEAAVAAKAVCPDVPDTPSDRRERRRTVLTRGSRVGTEHPVRGQPERHAEGDGLPQVFGVGEPVKPSEGSGTYVLEGLEQVAGDGAGRGHWLLQVRRQVRPPLIIGV
jgi:hypothetical protein